MRRGIALLGFVVAVATAAVAAMFVGHGPSTASASSHSEAPLISQDPRADNTDLYAFVSPDDTNKVTFVANYIPLESCGQRAELPELRRHRSLRDQDRQHRRRQGRHRLPVPVHDDRRGTRTRSSTTRARSRRLATIRTGTGRRPTASRSSTSRRTARSRSGKNGPVVLVDNAWTPPDNIGPRSTPNYDALAAAAVTTLSGGGKVFAGQRDDPFFVDLGSIFDLAGLRPFNPFHLIPLAADAGVDALKNYNTHSIVLQVPIADRGHDPEHEHRCLRECQPAASGRSSRRTGRPRARDEFVQVSRLGNPLINEVLIPLGQKDLLEPVRAGGRLELRQPLHDAGGRAPSERALRHAPQGHVGGALADRRDGSHRSRR